MNLFLVDFSMRQIPSGVSKVDREGKKNCCPDLVSHHTDNESMHFMQILNN